MWCVQKVQSCCDRQFNYMVVKYIPTSLASHRFIVSHCLIVSLRILIYCIYVIIRLNIIFVGFSNELVNSDIRPMKNLWSYVIITLQDTQYSHHIPFVIIIVYRPTGGDADVLIATTAVSTSTRHTLSPCRYTDAETLLPIRGKEERKSRVWHIHLLQRALGLEVCRLLSFAHAMAGCDTTS